MFTRTEQHWGAAGRKRATKADRKSSREGEREKDMKGEGGKRGGNRSNREEIYIVKSAIISIARLDRHCAYHATDVENIRTLVGARSYR